MSEEKKSKKNLVAKLCEVMAAVEKIPKRGINEHYGYTYATEADVVEHVRQELARRKVFLLPSVQGVTEREVVTRKGNKEIVTTVKVEYTFHDAESGETLAFTMLGSGQDAGDKGVYKALTGSIKYALMKAFLIPTGDDPERETSVKEPAKPQPKPTESPPPVAEDGGMATKKQLSFIWTLAQQMGLNESQLRTLMENRYQVTSSKQLTKDDASDFITYLKELRDANAPQEEEAPF